MHICHTNLIGDHMFKNLKIQHGGWWPSLKLKKRNIINAIWLILVKFCMMAHISSPDLTGCSKVKCLKIQCGRWLTF